MNVPHPWPYLESTFKFISSAAATMYPLRPARRVARVSLALDVPTELVIPGVVCVDTVTSATLPVRSRSPVAVLCSFYVDAVTVDGRSCNTDSHCSLTIIQQNLRAQSSF